MQSIVEPGRRAADGALMSCFDAAVVRQMFGDDLALFGSALSLLLRDHVALGVPNIELPHRQSERSQLQLRVHALRGCAGLLGATRIMQLAGEAETALEQGRPSDIVNPILQRLTAAFAQLREEAVVWLARQAQMEALGDVGTAPGRTPSTDDLDELCAFLDSRNLAALDKFRSLSSSLCELLGTACFGAVRDALGNMDFTLGAQLLRQGMDGSARGR